MGGMFAIDIISTCSDWRQLCPDAEVLARDAAEAALVQGSGALGQRWQQRVEIAVNLAGAADQRRLNRDYRGHDTPTNVLAFPGWEPGMRVPPGAPLLLGDVVLACETIAHEAFEQKKSIADHLRHLVVHGVLHLLGYDHERPRKAAEMEALETSILAKLGVPDPYRDTMSLSGPELLGHE